MLRFLIFLILIKSTHGSWPQFLGPERNGIALSETKIRIPSETEEFVQLWKFKIGEGHAGPVVSDGKVLLHHRIGNEEILVALNSKTGRILWKSAHPCSHTDNYGKDHGPKSTPTITNEKVYTYGIGGLLACTDLKTGKHIWSVNTAVKYKSASF